MFTNKSKVIFVVKKLVYKICLADTSATADDYKLRSVGIQAPLQFFTLSVSGYQSILHNFSIDFAKVLIFNRKKECFMLTFYFIGEIS